MSCLASPVAHNHAKKLLAAKFAPIRPTIIPDPASPSRNNESNLTLHKALPQPPRSSEHPLTVIQLLGEDAKDFGSWKILLSGQSLRHLRQIRRSDHHNFDIVKRKLQWVILIYCYECTKFLSLASGSSRLDFFQNQIRRGLSGKKPRSPSTRPKWRGTRGLFTPSTVFQMLVERYE